MGDVEISVEEDGNLEVVQHYNLRYGKTLSLGNFVNKRLTCSAVINMLITAIYKTHSADMTTKPEPN